MRGAEGQTGRGRGRSAGERGGRGQGSASGAADAAQEWASTVGRWSLVGAATAHHCASAAPLSSGLTELSEGRALGTLRLCGWSAAAPMKGVVSLNPCSTRLASPVQRRAAGTFALQADTAVVRFEWIRQNAFPIFCCGEHPRSATRRGVGYIMYEEADRRHAHG